MAANRISKVVILAGGLGTRLGEETDLLPKPMVEIGGRPILWHIMKSYSHYGINHFIICLGYKGYVVKEYFANYFLHQADVTYDIATNGIEVHNNRAEPWKVSLIETGSDTMTGGRIKRVSDFIGGEAFCMTYGDGVSDVDIGKLLEFHRASGKQATVTAVRPPGRFGALEMIGDSVSGFREKPLGDGAWINGGFFVLQPEILTLIGGDQTIWEREPMETLAARGQIGAFRHEGFWQPMDTLREKKMLQSLWDGGNAPWKTW